MDLVAVASALGAKFVRVTAGQAHPETDRESGIAWAIQGLSRLVEATRDAGATLVYENHGKPGAWQYTDFSQPPDVFLEIAEGTAEAGLAINFDTANATAFSDDPVRLLEQVIGRVASIHAADTARRGELEHVLLGTGVTPFPDLFATLKWGRLGWLDLHGGGLIPGARRGRSRCPVCPYNLERGLNRIRRFAVYDGKTGSTRQGIPTDHLPAHGHDPAV